MVMTRILKPSYHNRKPEVLRDTRKHVSEDKILRSSWLFSRLQGSCSSWVLSATSNDQSFLLSWSFKMIEWKCSKKQIMLSLIRHLFFATFIQKMIWQFFPSHHTHLVWPLPIFFPKTVPPRWTKILTKLGYRENLWRKKRRCIFYILSEVKAP